MALYEPDFVIGCPCSKLVVKLGSKAVLGWNVTSSKDTSASLKVLLEKRCAALRVAREHCAVPVNISLIKKLEPARKDKFLILLENLGLDILAHKNSFKKL